MSDFIKTYTTAGTRLTIARLSDSVENAMLSAQLPLQETSQAASAMLLSVCLVENRKEDNASVSVTLTYPALGRKFTALCERDGRVRVCADDCTPGFLREGVILDVTQRLPVRGDYTSVVSADNEQDAVTEYFRASQQTKAHFRILSEGNVFCAVLSERFPITEQAHQIYDEDADLVFAKMDNLTSPADQETFVAPYKKTGEHELKFGCTCTSRSIRSALAGISPEELEQLKDADGKLEVRCKHCGKIFRLEV